MLLILVHQQWINLEDTKHGMVHVRMQWLELTLDKNALKRVIKLFIYFQP